MPFLQIHSQQQLQAYERMFAKARFPVSHLRQLTKEDEMNDVTTVKEPASNRIYRGIISGREFDDYGRRVRMNKLDKGSCDIIPRFKERKRFNVIQEASIRNLKQHVCL